MSVSVYNPEEDPPPSYDDCLESLKEPNPPSFNEAVIFSIPLPLEEHRHNHHQHHCLDQSHSYPIVAGSSRGNGTVIPTVDPICLNCTANASLYNNDSSFSGESSQSVSISECNGERETSVISVGDSSNNIAYHSRAGVDNPAFETTE
jgi:hypothetical protein